MKFPETVDDRVQIYGFSTDRPVLEVTNVAPEYRFFTPEQKKQYTRLLCELEASKERGGNRAMAFPIEDYELYIISYDKKAHYVGSEKDFSEVMVGNLSIRADPEVIEYIKAIFMGGQGNTK